MKDIELRLIPTEISVDDDGQLYCEGLVNETNSWSQELGLAKRFREKISTGVFQRALDRAKRIDFLVEHDNTKLLATTENDSLQLQEDDQGLKMRAKIAQTSYGKDIYELMKEKLVNHMSFGMRVISDVWSKGLDGIYERTINDLELFEVSVVRNPAYTQSAIAARGFNVIEDVEIPDISEEREDGSKLEINKEIEKRAYYYTIDDGDDAVNSCLDLTAIATQLLKFVTLNTPEKTDIIAQLQKTIQTASEILILQTQKVDVVEEEVVNQCTCNCCNCVNCNNCCGSPDCEFCSQKMAMNGASMEGRSEEKPADETPAEVVEEKVADEVVETVEPVGEETRSEDKEDKVDLSELRKLIKEDLVDE